MTDNFLIDEVESNDGGTILKELEQCVNNLTAAKKRVASIEAELKEATKSVTYYEQERIPHLLVTNGIENIKLSTGERVSVKQNVSVTIKDDVKFEQFLRSRDEHDIIKLNLAFSRMSSDEMTKLFDVLNTYEFEAKNSVHAQTRAKYFRTLLGIGEDDRKRGIASGKYLTENDVQEFANVFSFYKTMVKI